MKQNPDWVAEIGSRVIRISTSWSGSSQRPGESGPRNVPVVERPRGHTGCPIYLVLKLCSFSQRLGTMVIHQYQKILGCGFLNFVLVSPNPELAFKQGSGALIRSEVLLTFCLIESGPCFLELSTWPAGRVSGAVPLAHVLVSLLLGSPQADPCTECLEAAFQGADTDCVQLSCRRPSFWHGSVAHFRIW